MFAKIAIFAFITFAGIFFIFNIPKPNLNLTDYHRGRGVTPLVRKGIRRTSTVGYRPIVYSLIDFIGASSPSEIPIEKNMFFITKKVCQNSKEGYI